MPTTIVPSGFASAMAALPRHTARTFDGVDDADAAQAATLGSLRLPRRKCGPVGVMQCGFHQARKIAAVADCTGWCSERHCGRLYQIAATNFRRVETEPQRREVHGSLDYIDVFEPADAPIDVDRHGVSRQIALEVEMSLPELRTRPLASG